MLLERDKLEPDAFINMAILSRLLIISRFQLVMNNVLSYSHQYSRNTANTTTDNDKATLKVVQINR